MKLSPLTRVSEPALSGHLAGQRSASRRPSPLARALWKRRFYLLLVALPTLLTAFYLYAFAAGQYVSEARFLVRGRQESPSGGALGAMIGAAGFKQSSEEALAVRDYLESHDALFALVGNIDLIGLYRRPEADFLSSLWFADPPAEFLQMYHSSMSSVKNDTNSGIITIRARGFRAEDARLIAEEQIRLSEAFVNQLSSRAREETLRVAQEELARAEQRVVASQTAVTAWRQQEQAVDPTKSATIGLEGLGALEGLLTSARAELQEKSAFMRPDNPQIATLRNRIASLQSEIAAHRQRLTRGGESLPGQIAAYERLLLERDFADKQLASATASLETARLDAQRQQMFLARVVEPNLAEYPLYPRAWLIVVSMFAVLSVLYGIGWMLVAGIREHAL
ncbi:capsule biosynthesis protein [Teichococcus vastitatis]|jgi:capsular polysaccharide transport system permease protein|uniref:Capsule biosynthesis protein n=1 Tax=Teichococcus vastitatis TaxID=2307076 RepID=A0ABS9WCX5_9PROT|nr:capsule biosynthesis protein [Pseudoroseomonas vastitatis]MCI0756489.1 capsule biosynthesis protein [Pseudoroseomonas vastitatis]